MDFYSMSTLCLQKLISVMRIMEVVSRFVRTLSSLRPVHVIEVMSLTVTVLLATVSDGNGNDEDVYSTKDCMKV